MKINFNQIVGIDQTGALDARGKFRPLYSVSLKISDEGSVLSYSSKYLPILDLNLWRQEVSRTLIVIDAVFGLPERLWLKGEKIRDLFHLTQNLTEFGLKGGEAFFSKLYHKRSGRKLTARMSEDELRDCERTVQAQSLFRSRPYQRNVQTGTLRIWHELSKQNLEDVTIWPFDAVQKKSQIVLAEGYPRLFADIPLPRSPEFENPNFRDAARLAFGAHQQMLKNTNFLDEIKNREGAIFSLHGQKTKPRLQSFV